MAELKEQIQKLIDLQQIDSEIFKLKALIEEKPKEIAALEAAFEEKKAGLKQAEEDLKMLQVKRKEKENELASKEEEVAKLQTQLYSLKTNKEYQAMLTEIEGKKADSSLIEEEILKNFDEVDVANSQVKKEQEFLKEQEKVLGQEKSKVDNELKDAKAKLDNFQQKRAKQVEGIDKQLLSQYERILGSRAGLAVAEVKGDSCQGCYMNLPPQVINVIKLGKEVVVCETCNRILYIDPASE